MWGDCFLSTNCNSIVGWLESVWFRDIITDCAAAFYWIYIGLCPTCQNITIVPKHYLWGVWVECFRPCYLNRWFCKFWIYSSKYYRPLKSWSALCGGFGGDCFLSVNCNSIAGWSGCVCGSFWKGGQVSGEKGGELVKKEGTWIENYLIRTPEKMSGSSKTPNSWTWSPKHVASYTHWQSQSLKLLSLKFSTKSKIGQLKMSSFKNAQDEWKWMWFDHGKASSASCYIYAICHRTSNFFFTEFWPQIRRQSASETTG